jgi:hypothetical protein
MLTQADIPVGRLKQAYRLNAQEADGLIIALARRNCIDLYKIWHEAVRFVTTEENNKKSLYDETAEPYFPDVMDLKKDLLQSRIATKRLLRHFLYSSRSGTPREHLQKIFDRVLHYTYDDPGEEHICSVNRILDMIYEQRHFGFHGKDKVDIAWEYVSPELFAKFCSFFDDAISANKEAAVIHLFEHGYSWDHAVKGLSREIVERILATAATVQAQTTQATLDGHPQEDTPTQSLASSIVVPRALWEGKSPEAICKAMDDEGFGKPIIAYVLSEWCEKPNKTKIGQLLGPRGENEHDSTSRSRTYKLLAEAEAFTIITE